MRISSLLSLLIVPAVATASLEAQQPSRTPAEVTKRAVAAGKTLYHTTGQCNTCHGDAGVGTGDGPSLVEGAWTLGAGDFAWLVHMTQHAGWGARTREGEPQPMHGPTVLDSVQVRRVAAYVWSISRKKTAPVTPASSDAATAPAR